MTIVDASCTSTRLLKYYKKEKKKIINLLVAMNENNQTKITYWSQSTPNLIRRNTQIIIIPYLH